MFFNNREYGKLIKKEKVNGSIVYTIENSKGKNQTISFDSDICPTANIGDEVFYIYNRSISSSVKKGVLLNDNLKEITMSYYNMLDNFIVALKETIPFVVLFALLGQITLHLTSESLMFILKSMGISHLDIISTCLLVIALILPTALSGLYFFHRFYKSIEKFPLLLMKRDRHFIPYKKEFFTRKDILFNKKIDDEDKRKLRLFIRNIDEMSSAEKLEMDTYIEEKKNMKVKDIEYLNILSLTNKLKIKKQVEQLLLK